VLYAQPKAGIDPLKVEKVMYEELDKLKNAPPSDKELQKAKNILLAGFFRQMKTINGRANTIGTYEVFFGDYHKLFEASDAYSRVSKEDVQRVAKAYLSDKNRTVASLIPEAEAPSKTKEEPKTKEEKQ
jgi:predicted Zn-dependent peptidase